MLVSGPRDCVQGVAHIDAVGSQNEICLHRSAVTEGDLAGIRVDRQNLGRGMQRSRRPGRVSGRGYLLESVVENAAMNQLPRMLPHLVGYGEIEPFQQTACRCQLIKCGHVTSPDFLGVYAPAAQQTVGIGCQMHGGPGLVGER